jgi:hypothetical protein
VIIEPIAEGGEHEVGNIISNDYIRSVIVEQSKKNGNK